MRSCIVVYYSDHGDVHVHECYVAGEGVEEGKDGDVVHDVVRSV